MKLAYTPAQVGAAADGDGLHAATSSPPLVPMALDEYPAAGPAFVTSPRAFRGRQMGQHEDVGTPDAQGLADGYGGGSLVAEHGPNAAMNPRQLDGGWPLAFREELFSQVGIITNSRGPGLEPRQAAPDPPRAGSTGADPARPSQVPRWLFFRLFDQGIAQRLGEQKIALASPLASTPISHANDTPDGVPNPGGAGSTGMQPISAQRNSFRLIPTPWDEQLVNTGAVSPTYDPAQAASSSQRSRGYRA